MKWNISWPKKIVSVSISIKSWNFWNHPDIPGQRQTIILLEYILLCQVMFTICFLLAGRGDKKKRVQFSDTFWRHCYCVSVSLCILQKFRTNISVLSWGFDFFSWIEIIKFVEVFHQQYSPNVMQATQAMSTKTGH